jgi:drug/metabolite transporter (DMT)-like permease
LRRQGIVGLIAVILAWGLVWPVNKAILEALSPLWMAALRSAIATTALFAMSLATRRLVLPPRADWPVVVSIALLHMVGFVVLANFGLRLVPTGRSVVLAYTTPLWVTPGASLFLGERLTMRKTIGVVLGLVGLGALFNPLAFDWSNRAAVFGNVVLLGAAFLWAASILHIRGHRWRSTPFELVPWEALLATIILMLVAGASRSRVLPGAEWSTWLVLLLLFSSIPGTALAYWAVAIASRSLPAVTTSLGLLGVPVVSIVTATFALGERVTPSLVIAIVLILGGVAVGTPGGDRGDLVP